MWSPVEQFDKLCFDCPKCTEKTTPAHSLTPVSWTNGCNAKYSPRLIHDINSNILLLSRVYTCNFGHEIYGHHKYFVEHEGTISQVPFKLWHSTGFTVVFMDHLEQMICSGLALQECEKIVQKNRIISFCRIQSRLIRGKQCTSAPDIDTMPILNSSPTRHALAGCFLLQFWENENAYSTEMMAGSVSSQDLWLSCDHTFRSAANIGVFRSADGKWVKQYHGLFCVLNSIGEVLTWKFVKDLQFSSVENQMKNLQQRLLKHGKQITEFYIDNCCIWRKKLQDVFGSHLTVLLDIFHAVQRISSKISKRHPFSFQCVQDLKLAFRHPSDGGPERMKPTPDTGTLHQNLDRFVAKWKDIEYNGVKVLSPSALREVNCILKHVDRGCLSNILPGRGTNRNERLHRELNRILHSSRIGVELGYALATCTFYQHNEKIRAANDKRSSRPIISKYSLTTICSEPERFGLVSPRCSAETSTQLQSSECTQERVSFRDCTYQSTIKNMVQIFENSDEFHSEEDETDESLPSKQDSMSLLLQAITNYYIFQHLSTLSKTCTVDSCIFFTSFLSMATKYSKTLNQELTSQEHDELLQRTLQQWNFRKISVPGDGNCLFTAIAYNLVNRARDNDEPILNRLQLLSNTPNRLEISEIAKELRLLVVKEWLGENSEYYQGFVTADIAKHAHQYLESGEFAGDLGDLMILTLSNILHIPITIFSNIPNLGVICITPTTGVDSTVPLYVAYNNYGSGHYDYAVPTESTSHSPPSSSTKRCVTKCFCGRNQASKATPCASDIIGNCRCPCAKNEQQCTSACRCKGCSNIYGIKSPSSTRERVSYSTQKQPLAGRKGSQFLKIANERQSDGQTSSLEQLLLAVILVHFMAKGIRPKSENMFTAHSIIYDIIGKLFPLIDIPIFKRSSQFFTRYMQTVQKKIELFSQLFPK